MDRCLDHGGNQHLAAVHKGIGSWNCWPVSPSSFFADQSVDCFGDSVFSHISDIPGVPESSDEGTVPTAYAMCVVWTGAVYGIVVRRCFPTLAGKTGFVVWNSVTELKLRY